MGFFNTVNYAKAIQDHGWYAKAESLADACRAPARWVAAELWDGGKTVKVSLRTNEGFSKKLVDAPVAETTLGKVARVGVGAILAIPGYLLSIPLMATAYACSPEIRLKHAYSVRNLTEQEATKLKSLIEDRQKLSADKQKDPITCMICSIVCLLCSIVCSAEA